MNNKLVCGKREFSTENDGLIDEKIFVSDSLVADELGVDTLTASVADFSLQTRLLAADGELVSAGGHLLIAQGGDAITTYPYGAPVYAWHGSDLLGKFFFKNAVRDGSVFYTINCVSGVGLLLDSDHYGGMYTGETAGTVIADIIGGIVPYTVASDVAATALFGWLPIGTRRDNLRAVLFAIGAVLEKDTAGEINIVYPVATDALQIEDDDIYEGGSVDLETPATGVDVTEHSYLSLASDDTETLYDGEVAADTIVTPGGKTVLGALVTFSAPYHDLYAENGNILESSVNYAVLGQSPACVLTGRAYTHTTRIVSRRQGSGTPNVLSAKEAYMVNSLCSELVADRLMSYYANTRIISNDIVMHTEDPGDHVALTDPFGDTTDGYIREMDIVVSGILKASCTIATNYTPTPGGNYYEHAMAITASQTVTIPAECKGKIRAVLIGGGHGGYLGNPGETVGNSWLSHNDSAAGGEPGEPGEGGRVFIVTLAVQPGQQLAAVIGTGGAGATQNAAAQEGSATTLGTYSSASGFPSDDGYIDVLSGSVYAVPGGQGIAGGHGVPSDGDSTSVTWNGVTYYPGSPGEDVRRAGGLYADGGLGGGAAAGANGLNGEDGDFSYGGGNFFAEGGNGGAGATPVKAPNGSIRGQGGYGGHGGGGGGAGGDAHGDKSQMFGITGTPGAGGEGGDGAPGILLIYY